MVTADAEHPIRVHLDPVSREPRPYITVRPGLEARINRAVFYELVALAQAETMSGPGWVLVGDAAHGVHPIAGQGLNLGLRDVAHLAEELSQGLKNQRDIGSPEILNQYARNRQGPELPGGGAEPERANGSTAAPSPLLLTASLHSRTFPAISPLAPAVIADNR